MHPVALSLARVEHPKSTDGSGLSKEEGTTMAFGRASFRPGGRQLIRREPSLSSHLPRRPPSNDPETRFTPTYRLQTPQQRYRRCSSTEQKIRGLCPQSCSELPLPQDSHELATRSPPKPIDANYLTTYTSYIHHRSHFSDVACLKEVPPPFLLVLPTCLLEGSRGSQRWCEDEGRTNAP